MKNYFFSLDATARELANTPQAQDDETLQAAICRKHGVFLDCITDDEAEYLSRLVEEYANI